MTPKEEKDLKELIEDAVHGIKKEREDHLEEREAFRQRIIKDNVDHDFLKKEIAWLKKAVEPMKNERDRFTWLGRLGITIFGAVTAVAGLWWLFIQIYDRYKPVIKE